LFLYKEKDRLPH